MVPLYRGPFAGRLVRGSVHSIVPSARPTKFCTVFGAWSGNRRNTMVPIVVRMVAVRSSATDTASLVGILISVSEQDTHLHLLRERILSDRRLTSLLVGTESDETAHDGGLSMSLRNRSRKLPQV